MGLLDSIVGAALGGGQGGASSGQGALLNAVLGMLTQGQGGGGAGAGGGLAGLGQLVEQFQHGGLGDVIGSWISTGQNLPVSADQLGQVLGNERIAGMASQLGLQPNEVLGQLSQLLPEVVDKLTPHGQIPAQPDMGNLGALLGGLLQQR